jgi:putative oxidoreductase
MLAWLNFVFLPVAARLCLVVLFPFSGIDKIIHWDDAMTIWRHSCWRGFA